MSRRESYARAKASPVGRPFRNLTISQRSEAFLTAVAKATGLARGRIVDIALATIDVCQVCHGTGVSDGSLGPGTAVCGGCAGHKIIPTESNAVPEGRDSFESAKLTTGEFNEP